MVLWAFRTARPRFSACVIVFGTAVLVIDWAVGMPGYWTAIEGPCIVLLGVLYLVFAQRIPEKE